MKLDYKFHNLCGTVYRKGNIHFSSGGDCLLSPVGNRVSCFDLKNNKSFTLPFENSRNISKLCVSSKNGLLISIDEDGKSILFSLQTNTKLDHFTFKKKVYDIKYSPDGKFIAVTFGRSLQLWHAPGTKKEFAPFTLLTTYASGYDDVVCIDWSNDSRFILVGSKDMTSRIHSIHPMEEFTPFVLTGHRNTIVGCFFEKDSLNSYTVSRDGAVFVWKCDRALKDFTSRRLKRKYAEDGTEEEVSNDKDKEEYAKWMLQAKHFFHQDQTDLTCAEFHKESNVLVVGFSTGIFMLYEMPEFVQIHSLSITQHKINSVAINPSGDWLAFGSSTLGQLLVWEWRSESYIMKQQGHFYDMNVVAYSPDGQYIATGGDDGKVKLWNSLSGFCFVTFHEHSGSIKGVEFAQNGQVVVSASTDGTVRAFDLYRYRNFRTFASPRPCQFSCLALDSSGEVICAGSVDTFEIFMWSMQTGRLLEVMAGHEGPVSCLSFSPISATLVSGSWDNTVKVWDVYNQRGAKETFSIGSNVTAITYRPDGHEVAVASLDGQIIFWQPDISMQVGSVDGKKDLGAGRKASDLVTAKKTGQGKSFSSLCYSADGQCVLAGGKSKFVCIYHVEQQILLRRFTVSCNKSMDGMQQFLNSKNMTEAGPLDLIDIDRDSDDEQMRLPGVLKGDMSSRSTQPEIQTKAIRFSPTGRAWAAATTEGLLIFSLDTSQTFRPEDLDTDVTPDRIIRFSETGHHTHALSYAFRLNEEKLIHRVLEAISIQDVPVVASAIPEVYLEKLLNFIAKQLECSGHLEFYLSWCKELLVSHGRFCKTNSRTLMPILRLLQKSLSRHSGPMASLCDSNRYSLKYLLAIQPKSSGDIEPDVGGLEEEAIESMSEDPND